MCKEDFMPRQQITLKLGNAGRFDARNINNRLPTNNYIEEAVGENKSRKEVKTLWPCFRKVKTTACRRA